MYYNKEFISIFLFLRMATTPKKTSKTTTPSSSKKSTKAKVVVEKKITTSKSPSSSKSATDSSYTPQEKQSDSLYINSLILDSDIVPDDTEEEVFLESKKKEISQLGYTKLLEEIKELEDNAIPSVNNRIKEAREFGDLSENAEYQSAINEKQMLETRIAELRETIANSTVVQSSKQSDTVQYGSTVTLSFLDNNETIQVTIVWSAEISFEEKIKHISFDSPIGMAIEGKKPWDVCKVRAEKWRFDIKIMKIQ